MKKPLVTLFVVNGVFIAAAHLLGPLYAVFVKQTLGGTVLIISLSWSVFIVASLVFMLLIAKVGDRVKERELLLAAGFLVRAVAWGLYLFVATIPALLAVQILLGLGEALGTPAFHALLAQHVNQKQAIRQYSTWAIISSAIAALATLLGGLIVTTGGFQLLFLIMVTISLLSFFILIRQPRKLL